MKLKTHTKPKLAKTHRDSRELYHTPSITPPPPSTKLFGNIEQVETEGSVFVLKANVDGNSPLADAKGKEVEFSTPSDHTSESGASQSTASTPDLPPLKLEEDHNIGGPEGHAVIHHIDESQQREVSSGVLGGLNQCIATIAALFSSVISIPTHLVEQLRFILSRVVSLYAGFQVDPHEPLLRRISLLEIEVDRLRPFQKISRKHSDPKYDRAHKISLLETELTSTRKILNSVLSKQQELFTVLEHMRKYKLMQAQEKCW